MTALRYMKYTNLSQFLRLSSAFFCSLRCMIWFTAVVLACLANAHACSLLMLSSSIVVHVKDSVLSWNCNVEEQKENSKKKNNAKCQKITKTTHLAANNMTLSPLCASLACSEYAGINRKYSHSCCACKHLVWINVLTRICSLIGVCCAWKHCQWLLWKMLPLDH